MSNQKHIQGKESKTKISLEVSLEELEIIKRVLYTDNFYGELISNELKKENPYIDYYIDKANVENKLRMRIRDLYYKKEKELKERD